MSGTADAPPPARRWRPATVLPLLAVAALVALFLTQLGAPPRGLPSALVGQPAPEMALPPIEGLGTPGLATADLRRGRVTLVNVWASWCPPCRAEHPLLMQLAREGTFALAGINNKDEPENARRFLGELGNPFARIGADRNGRASIDWGVYGVPETFVVDGAGRVAYRHVGPLTPEIVRDRLLPEIRRAGGG